MISVCAAIALIVGNEALVRIASKLISFALKVGNEPNVLHPRFVPRLKTAIRCTSAIAKLKYCSTHKSALTSKVGFSKRDERLLV